MSTSAKTNKRSEARRLKLRALAGGFKAIGATVGALTTGVTVGRNGLLFPPVPVIGAWSADVCAVTDGLFVALDF